MGRDLVHNEEHGWAIFETVTQYCCRVSRWCDTKGELLVALIENGVPIRIVEMFDEHDHLPSIMVGGGRMYTTLQIDEALLNAGLTRAGDPNQAVPELYTYEEE